MLQQAYGFKRLSNSGDKQIQEIDNCRLPGYNNDIDTLTAQSVKASMQ
jgi:hypothetical protein